MKKFLVQGSITIFIFLLIWVSLSKIDWVSVLKVDKITDKTEQKLGSILLDVFTGAEKEIENIHIVITLDSIVSHICRKNGINREIIKVHVIEKEEINAFALPNGHIIVYSGLVLACGTQDELASVICHEIAHIELNHVMKKLVKEIGLSVLISMATGSAGPEIVKEAAKLVSSTAFDRSLEKQADIKAVEYLINANVNPRSFADFLYKIAEKETEASKYLTWISTHPHSIERAGYIIEHSINNHAAYHNIISCHTWDKMIEELKR
jgi:beta-barrel assembly-enhancing protease